MKDKIGEKKSRAYAAEIKFVIWQFDIHGNFEQRDETLKQTI